MHTSVQGRQRWLDGKTGVVGRMDCPRIAEIGECVMFMHQARKTGIKHKLDPNLRYGVWLGLDPRTNEARVGTTTGVVRARAIRTRPDRERWSVQAIDQMMGVP